MPIEFLSSCVQLVYCVKVLCCEGRGSKDYNLLWPFVPGHLYPCTTPLVIYHRIMASLSLKSANTVSNSFGCFTDCTKKHTTQVYGNNGITWWNERILWTRFTAATHICMKLHHRCIGCTAVGEHVRLTGYSVKHIAIPLSQVDYRLFVASSQSAEE